ncbi:MAG: hypothetical protein AVDCRST_MAG55-1200, partial [uncultured Rubrobacteraceae bacterium]
GITEQRRNTERNPADLASQRLGLPVRGPRREELPAPDPRWAAEDPTQDRRVGGGFRRRGGRADETGGGRHPARRARPPGARDDGPGLRLRAPVHPEPGRRPRHPGRDAAGGRGGRGRGRV